MDFKKKEKSSCATKWIIAILVVLLIVAIGYIGYNEYQKREFVKMQQVAAVYYDQGYQKAIIDVFQQTNSCQVVPIQIGNETKDKKGIIEYTDQCVSLILEQVAQAQQAQQQGQLQPTQQKK